MTTIPQITTPIPSGTGVSSCQITIPDYSVLREQNLSKINTYYKTLLDGYTVNNNNYTSQSTSSNPNLNTNAQQNLKVLVDNSNKQIVNLSQTMINNVNQDNDLINEQNNQLKLKMAEIDNIINNIKLLKDNNTEMTILSGARQDSLSSTRTSAEDMNFTTNIYIGISILLTLLIIGLIMYLVYSNYTTKSSTNTNLYKNIAINNRTI